MFWDDIVRRWRRDAKVVSPRLYRGAGGHVAVLPSPRRQRQSRFLLLLVMLSVLGSVLLVASGGSSDAEPTPARSVIVQPDG